MHNPAKALIAILVSLVVSGCAGKKIKIDSNDPLFRIKNEFYTDYEFYVFDEELRTLVSLTSIEAVDKFKEDFWKIRDTDPRTTENEEKIRIDKNIRDVKNEVLFNDIDVLGTRFDRNGGLKSDLAHVYLLHGPPLKGHKFKLPEGDYHVELMAWYYLDYQGRHLMRFLFYEDSGQMRLFKDQFPIDSLEYLLNPLFSPLKKISNRPGVSTIEEMWAIWQELERDDPEGVFRMAMFGFSDYTHIDKDTRWTIDKALAPPEPAALTAERFKPTILGQPGDLLGREFISNSYNSFVPAELDVTKSDRPSFFLILGYSNIDWELKETNVEAVLDLRISFQHKETRNITEFEVRLPIPKPLEEVKRKAKGVVVGNAFVPVVMKIALDNVLNFAQGGKPGSTLSQLINDLEPGTYIINGDLWHAVTKKSNAWHEEIVIK